MKYYTKYIPYFVFFTTIFLGIITMLFVYILQNPIYQEPLTPAKSSAEEELEPPIAKAEEIEPTQDHPGEVDESIFAEFGPKPPVCLSFLSATDSIPDETGKYPPEAIFDFSVAAYDPNEEDLVNKIEFEFYKKSDDELVETVMCSSLPEDLESASAFCTDMKYTNQLDESGQTELEVMQANLRGYSFPNSGDFYVKAFIFSSDGSRTGCEVGNGVEDTNPPNLE